ncbi:MAG: nucleotidyltransferase family protein, partial [Candidatus Dormibacteraceae bacterium]
YGPAAPGSGKPPWLPPVVLDRALWPMAQALGGDEGARAIFRHRPELVQGVAVAGRPEDADTAADLERIQRLVLE